MFAMNANLHFLLTTFQRNVTLANKDICGMLVLRYARNALILDVINVLTLYNIVQHANIPLFLSMEIV